MKKRISVFILLLIISLQLNTITSYAYVSGTVYDKNKLETWRQQGQGADPRVNTVRVGAGMTVMQAGCGYFTFSSILVKSGLEKVGSFEPFDLVDKVVSGGYLNSFEINVARVNEMYPEVTTVHNRMNVGLSNADQILGVIKTLYEEGLYVEVVIRNSQTGGHYIFFDSPTEDGNDFYVTDSAFASGSVETQTFKQLYESGTYVDYLHAFSVEGKPSNKQKSVYGFEASESEASEEDKQLTEKLIREWDLVGMEEKEKAIKDVQVPLYHAEALDVNDQAKVQEIQDSMNNAKPTMGVVYNVSRTLLGILLLLYGVMMLMAYLFDYTNTFIDISLLSIISFGRFKILDKDEKDLGLQGYDSSTGKTYLTVSMLIVRVSVIILIGLAFVSGIFNDFLYWFVNWVKDLMS